MIFMMARDNQDDAPWEADALRLRTQVERVRAINRLALWRDEIGAKAWRSHLPEIVDMVDYACATTARYLNGFLADPGGRTFESLRRDYLEAQPVPFNAVMIAAIAPIVTNFAAPRGRYIEATSAIGALLACKRPPGNTPKLTTDVKT